MVPLRRVFGDALISTAAVGSLLLILVLADDRVRDQFHRFGVANASSTVTQIGLSLRDGLGIVVASARDVGMDHASMLIFMLVAAVLLLAMTRT